MSSSEEHHLAEAASALDNPAFSAVGASRRSGVIWTNEARNDMFRRRERGEGWESICQDYPTRSRHAMQQQYSMMKKQKQMAEGTWTNNRRGRKRKEPNPELLGAQLQRLESGMDDTENDMSVTPSDFEHDDDMMVDPMDVGTPGPEFPPIHPAGGVQGILDFNNSRPPTMLSNRPSPLSRSATDPAPAPAPRGRGRGRGGRISSGYAPPDIPQNIAPKSFTPVNSMEDAHMKSAKRPLDANSNSPSAKRQKAMVDIQACEDDSSEALTEVPFQEPTVMFTQAQLANFFKEGADNAARAKKHIENDSIAHVTAIGDANLRANRRVRETEDKLKEITYRHRADVRGLEDIHKEKMAVVQADYEAQIRSLKADLILARSGAAASAVKNAPTSGQEPTSGQPAQAISSQDEQLIVLVEALTDLKPRYEAEIVRRKNAEGRISSLEQKIATTPASVGPSNDVITSFRELESMIRALDAHAGELSLGAMQQHISSANSQCAVLCSLLGLKSPYPPPVAHAPPQIAPHMPSPMHNIPPSISSPGQAPMHNTSLPPYGVRRPLPVSASASPAPVDRGYGTPPTSHPAITKPFENNSYHSPSPSHSQPPPQAQAQAQMQAQMQPRVEPARPYAPVSISSLISQEPSPSLPAAENNTLAPMQFPAAHSQSSTPQPLPSFQPPPRDSPSAGQPKNDQSEAKPEITA